MKAIFLDQKKKSKKIPFQETQTKRIFSWAKKNNLRGRKM